MRKYARICVAAFWIAVMMLNVQRAEAAPLGIIEVIKAAVKKAIVAMDLRIQRLQNKTVWLQNAQKTLENAVSKLKLDEIADWSDKQKEQYRVYYEELTKVKSLISYYQRISDVAQKQLRLVNEYNRAWGLLSQDANFTADEISHMGEVYNGILQSSMDNIDQITVIVKSFTTSMSDAKRVELINSAAEQIDANYSDLMRYNQQNIVLSLQRAKAKNETESVKKLYGLP